MKNLKVWQKLTVMGVVFMIPFAVVTWRLVASVNTLGVEFARKEARGADYYGPVLTLLQELQQRRDLAGAWLNGDASLAERVGAESADVEKAIQAVVAIDARLGDDLKTTGKWNELKAAILEVLAPGGAAAGATASFQRHTKVINDTVAFIALVGDNSNLTLDPDLDS